MSPPRNRPAHTADERTQLVAWLDMQRALVHWKCEGLSEADAHRSVLPASPMMTMAGVVSHLRWVEDCWFEVIFLAKETGNPQFADGPPDTDMMVDDIPLGRLLEEYERACAASNEIVAGHSLDDIATHPEYGGDAPSLRWILLHMLEETARHVGHMDAIRELLDGQKGYY